MQVDPSKLKPFVRTSASQITTVNRCGLRWWWQKIAGIPYTVGAGAILGSAVHKQLEDYLKKGTAPDGTKAGRIATVLIPLLPDPKTVDAAHVERRFGFKVAGTEIQGIGYIDLIRPGLEAVDHKTRSDARWIVQPDQLKTDIQSILYSSHVAGRYEFTDGPVTFAHYNALTSVPHKAIPVRVSMTPDLRAVGMDRVGISTRTMIDLAKETDPGKVSHNLEACNDYGGCPHKARCALHGIKSMGAVSVLFNRENRDKEQGRMASLAERLAAKRAAMAAGEQTPTAVDTTPERIEAGPPAVTPESIIAEQRAQEAEAAHARNVARVNEQTTTIDPPAEPMDWYPPATGINPPDGTPMVEPQPAPGVQREAKKAAKTGDVLLPDGRRVGGLSKSDAETVWTELRCELFGCAGMADVYSGRSALGLSPKKTEIKADIILILELLKGAQAEPVQAEPVETPEPVENIQPRAVVVETPEPVKTGDDPSTFTLLVGCTPIGVVDVDWVSVWIKPIEDAAAAAHNVSHPKLVGYGKGGATVLEMLRIAMDDGSIQLPAMLVDTAVPMYPEVRAYLVGLADVVIIPVGV